MGKTETWYVTEDDSVADPRDVSEGKDGKLRHKDGRVVAYADHGPRSRSIDVDAPDAGPKKGKKKDKEAEPPVTEDMQPETPKRGYKTRETKAD